MKNILTYKPSIYTALGMISLKPMSGYDIKKIIQNDTQFFWPDSDGQLYPTLNRCHQDGLLSVHEEGQQRIRKIYTITAKGLSTLQTWLWQMPKPSQQRNEMVLKLYFGKHTPTDILIQQIQHHKHHTQLRIDVFENIRYQRNKSTGDIELYCQLSLEQGYLQAKAELQWCMH